MTIEVPATFTDSIDRFVAAAGWLSDEHLPAVVALRTMAGALDAGDLAPALLGQFGLTYRNLAAAAPKVMGEPDPVDDLIEGMRG